MNQIYIKLTL